MFSTPRKIGTIGFIIAIVNIMALLLVFLFFAGQRQMEFYWKFILLMYVITVTVINLLLVIALRAFVQDSELESSNNAVQVKKLRERIEALEHKTK